MSKSRKLLHFNTLRRIIITTNIDICTLFTDKHLGGMKMKKFLAMALAAVMVIGVAGCGSSSETPAEGDGAEASASGENVIKFGVFEPQTGENGGGGLQEVYGMRYANQIYPTVEIGGTEYKIELVEVDNKSDKTEAVTAAQKLVAEGVIGVLGSYGSGAVSYTHLFSAVRAYYFGCGINCIKCRFSAFRIRNLKSVIADGNNNSAEIFGSFAYLFIFIRFFCTAYPFHGEYDRGSYNRNHSRSGYDI